MSEPTTQPVNTLPTDTSPLSADAVMTVKNADGSLVRVPLSNIADLTANVFWATYGTTTSAQINAADSAGKIVMCKRTGSVYLMVFNEENYAIFTCVDSDSKTVYSLICNENAWSNSSLAIPYPSSATPQDLGIASAGSSSDYSRADHVHAKPSAYDVGAVAVAQGVAHAGEFCVVGSDGNITTMTLSTWQWGSY